jgi:hypothetical protein
MFAAAAGLYGPDMDIYRPHPKKRSVSPTPDTDSSSLKSVDEIVRMVRAFDPEKDWTNASERFGGLVAPSGSTISDFRDKFLERERLQMLAKVRTLVTKEIEKNIVVAGIIAQLSGTSPPATTVT